MSNDLSLLSASTASLIDYDEIASDVESVEFARHSVAGFQSPMEKLNFSRVKLQDDYLNLQDGEKDGGWEYTDESHFEPAQESPAFTSIVHVKEEKSGPQSYYHEKDMNVGPVDVMPRMTGVPSQYQLESLTEIYVLDYPKLLPSVIPSPAKAAMPSVPSDNQPGAVVSEYITEMLY